MDNVQSPIGNPALDIYFMDAAQKKNKKVGLEIARAFYTKQTSNNSDINYFSGRNAKWVENLLWAKGSQPMKEFLDYMSVSDANKAYVNIDMTQSRIAAQFINTIIQELCKNQIYPSVKAVDNGSLKEKDQRKKDALYRMYDADNIAEMEQAAEMPLEPIDAYVPRDELSADVYFKLEDRLPKEIRFEEMLESALNAINFDRVVNRKGLYSMAVLNCEATKIEKSADGVYLPKLIPATSLVYNFFINDTGDCEVSEIGHFSYIKAKDIRAKYGKSDKNKDGLSEKEIYELVRASTIKNKGIFNILWDDKWNSNTIFQNQPYDDYSVYIFDFEKDCGEDVYFVEKTDAYGKLNIQQKKNIPYQQKTKDGTIIEQPKPENTTITKGIKNTWMHGVYAPYSDKILYWGEPDLIISPYDNVYKTLSSYTINIPNNDGQYVPSLFERILEPLREYQLVKLKRKQLIAAIEPDGYRVDVESARNIDLGNGDTFDWLELVRIKRQTGVELWSSKDIDPLKQAAPPISEAAYSHTVQKIIELTNVLASIVNEIRMLIGSSIYLEGGDLGDRTAAQLAENQTENASNVFGYVYTGHLQLWEETCYKLTCLHWDDVVRKEPESKNDLINTRFDTKIIIKSTEYERQLLEKNIDRWSAVLDGDGNPLISPKDAMRVRNIGNYKLAQLYLADIVEENRQRSEEEKQKRAQENIQAQQGTAQMTADANKKLQDEKINADKEMESFKSQADKEKVSLQGIFDIIKNMTTPIKDVNGNTTQPQLPDYINKFIQTAFTNVAIPLMEQNKQMAQSIISNEMQQQLMQQQMAQGQPPAEQNIHQENMQPQMA